MEESKDLGEESKSSSGSSESEDSSDEDVFEAEQIISHKKERGKYKYRIRWYGYSENDDTWEPKDNLLGENALRILNEYKLKHNIDSDADTSSSKKKNYEYVENAGEESEWFVSPTASKKEIRNLYVQDRILDETEKCLTVLQNDSSRLTRSQLKMILPEKVAKSDSQTATKEPKKRTSRRSTNQSNRPSTSKRSPSPLPVKKKAKKRVKKELDDTIEEKPHQTEAKSEPIPKPIKEPEIQPKVEKTPKSSIKKVSLPKSTIMPISRIGMDPKQSVTKRPEAPFKPLSSYKIPKKAVTPIIHPESSKPIPKPTSKPIPRPELIKPKVQEVKKELPASEHLINTNEKPPIQWQTTKDNIVTKECNLPGTNLSLTATLNIQPAQLTSYNLLLVETPTINSERISQNAFNDAVLTNKISIVRATLRRKIHSLELDFMDDRGRTLLHKLSETNCDQQHTQDEIIDCLVNAGASMSIPESEYMRTSLHLAVFARRTCHVRKLIQLGSPINSSDMREETPLITALKMNNTDLAKYLLSSGATYQNVFSNKFKLTNSQQKPVLNYQNLLQDCMGKARRSIMTDVTNFFNISPVFQSPLYESYQLDFMVNNKPENNMLRLCPILMFALIDNSDKMTAVCWGDLPIECVHINGNQVELLHENNQFFYLAAPLNQQNTINVTLDRAKTQYSKRILAAQVFAVELGF